MEGVIWLDAPFGGWVLVHIQEFGLYFQIYIKNACKLSSFIAIHYPASTPSSIPN